MPASRFSKDSWLAEDEQPRHLPGLFGMLGAFAGGHEAPFDADAAAAVWQVDADQATQALTSPVRAALLSQSDKHYSLCGEHWANQGRRRWPKNNLGGVHFGQGHYHKALLALQDEARVFDLDDRYCEGRGCGDPQGEEDVQQDARNPS